MRNSECGMRNAELESTKSVRRKAGSARLKPEIPASLTLRGTGHNPQSAIQLLEKALSLYRGHFLPADAGKTWTVSYRERLRSKFIRLTMIFGRHLEDTGQWDRATE